jgi:hypothetical protein
MNGEKCYTLTADNESIMYVDENGVTIVYPTGNELHIPRSMVVEAFNLLKRQGVLTVEDVHETITHRNGARTDRLFAVLRKIPGVRFDKRPRKLYYQG